MAGSARYFEYDVENRLLKKRPASTGAADLTLVYDAEGRLAKYSTDNGTTYTSFVYDGVNLIAEYNNAGTLTNTYVHGTGMDEPIVWFNGSAYGSSIKRYFVSNYQGSIIGYTNDSGVRQATYKYDAYGRPMNVSNAEDWSGARFRYTGQTMLYEARLYYYKARVYDPVYGHFMQTDPIGSKDDLDLYAYTGNDPVNGSDPTGLRNTGGDKDFKQPSTGSSILGDAGEQSSESAGPSFLDMVTAMVDPQPFDKDDAYTQGNTELGDWAAMQEIRREWGIMTVKATTEYVAAFIPIGGLATRTESMAARAANVACCFVAGTMVSTSEGLRSIETIEVGDLVLSKDEATGQTAFKPVTTIIPKHDRVIVEIRFAVTLPNGTMRISSFETTADHPWRSIDGRWLETEQLTKGEIVSTAYGNTASVLSIVNTNRTKATYNLEVADFHTYFVGSDRVWVHNICPVKLAAGALKYPAKVGKFEWHHLEPLYLGGAKNGVMVRLPAEYHQLITNAFR